MSSSYPKTKPELLAHYAEHEVHEYYQLDAFCRDEMYGGWNHELRSGLVPVRIQILRGTEQALAVEMLENLLNWFRTIGFFQAEDSGDTPPKTETPASQNAQRANAIICTGTSADELRPSVLRTEERGSLPTMPLDGSCRDWPASEQTPPDTTPF